MDSTEVKHSMKLDSPYHLSTFLLESASNQDDVFGINGLPLTPSSIKMVGNFYSFVASFNSSCKPCPYLTTYLDCIRSKNEKITLVFEHYPEDISNQELTRSDLDSLARSGLLALYHLHYVLGAVHGLITPQAFLYTGNRQHSVKYKLAHWPLNIITNCGQLCQSVLMPEDIRFVPIEQLLLAHPVRKSDIWSLGLSLLYFMLPSHRAKIPSDPFELAKCEDAAQVLNKLGVEKSDLSEKWFQFFLSSLHPSPQKRCSVKELMNLLCIEEPTDSDLIPQIDHLMKSCDINSLDDIVHEEQITRHLDIHDFYYLWCITYPTKDADKEKKKLPSILSIPRLIILESENSIDEKGNSSNSSFKFIENTRGKIPLENVRIVRLPPNRAFKTLPIETINERLLNLSKNLFNPVIFSSDLFSVDLPSEKSSECGLLPLPIRELDFDYQCERLMVFKTLLNGYPFIRNQLINESRVDICPHYRAQIWASLLNVRWSDRLQYEKIDKISSTTTDRQIAVDIPRCHQYNDMLASTEGHRKLTRILKAWLALNESHGEVYWQGLDSLAAPFVILNFNNEPQAFACFNLFISKYLHGFFQKDNSASIQEYLSLFQIVTSFHDPVMSHHFAELGFVPDLYAISWFLTMFTHILPLYQVLQLWDTLILGNDSFPLFIGLAILHQLRDRILDFTFNDCILIFSDLPQIDIDRCVRNSVKFFISTPQTLSQRGLWPLDCLKQYPRLPRIHIDDLAQMFDKNSQISEENSLNQVTNVRRIILIDCRTKEDISLYGIIKNSIKFDDYCNQLNQDIQCRSAQNLVKVSQHQVTSTYHFKHNLIVVINSVDKAMQLIDDYHVPRLCYLELCGQLPKWLL